MAKKTAKRAVVAQDTTVEESLRAELRETRDEVSDLESEICDLERKLDKLNDEALRAEKMERGLKLIMASSDLKDCHRFAQEALGELIAL